MASTPPLEIPQHSGVVRLKRAREHGKDTEEVDDKKRKNTRKDIFRSASGVAGGPLNQRACYYLEQPVCKKVSQQGTSNAFYAHSSFQHCGEGVELRHRW